MTDFSTLKHLEELAHPATPGPWFVDKNDKEWIVIHENSFGVSTLLPLARTAFIRKGEDPEANAAFIAACSPDVILALIAKLREWDKEFSELT